MLVALLTLSSLGLVPGLVGCGGGLVPGESAQLAGQPQGGTPLADGECEAADDGSYVLGYNQTAGDVESAMLSDIALIRSSGGSVVANFAPQLPITVAQLPAELLPKLRQNPAVSFVSKNCKYHKQSAGLAQVSWALDRIDQRQRPGDGVYQMAGTGRGVDAYVLDTGIYAEHEEFGGRANKLYTAILDGHGADDCDGHGTEVAGLIGGLVHGVAKEVRLQAIRVADCTGTSNDMLIAAGIQQAIIHHQANNTPGVLSISLAAPKVSMAASTALDAASAAGILVVAAAGNLGVDACTHFPAARPFGMMMTQRDPEPLIVGVVNRDDQGILSGVSRNDQIKYDYGTCIDLFAPGDNVQTISYQDKTSEVTDSGTSLSAAFVAGVAAIVLEKYPRATPADIKKSILQQATTGVVTGSMTPSPKLIYSIPNVNGAVVVPRAIQLARPVLPQPAMKVRQTFSEATFLYGAVPTSYRAVLSSDLSGNAATSVDDSFELDCVDVDGNGVAFGQTRPFHLDYSSFCLCDKDRPVPSQPRQILSSLVARGQPGQCKLALSDKCGQFISTTSLFLNFQAP